MSLKVGLQDQDPWDGYLLRLEERKKHTENQTETKTLPQNTHALEHIGFKADESGE